MAYDGQTNQSARDPWDWQARRAEVARAGVAEVGLLLGAIERIKGQTDAQRARRYARALALYRRYLYWARRLNAGYEPPAEAHQLARSLDPTIA